MLFKWTDQANKGGGWNVGVTTVIAQKAETWPQHTGHTAFCTSTNQQRATGSCMFSDLPLLVKRHTGWLEHLVVWPVSGQKGRKRTLAREGVLEVRDRFQYGVSEFKEKSDPAMQSWHFVLIMVPKWERSYRLHTVGVKLGVTISWFGVVHGRAKRFGLICADW